jgi:hypothetical protein
MSAADVDRQVGAARAYQTSFITNTTGSRSRALFPSIGPAGLLPAGAPAGGRTVIECRISKERTRPEHYEWFLFLKYTAGPARTAD